MYEPDKRLTAGCALEHKWIKNKENSKQNLQRSISSNWSNSCVSLKNEKGLKRQAKANDSTDLCRNSAKKSTYGATRSRDDELNKESARVVEGHKGSWRDVSTNRDYVPKNVYNACDAKKRSDPISGKVQKNDLKNAQGDTMFTKTKIKGIEADQNGKDVGQKEPSTRQHSDTNVQRRQSSKVKSKVSPMINPGKNSKQNNAANIRAQDYNGNLAFVKRLPSSQQHAKSCVEDTMSMQSNLEDLSKETLLIEYIPLSRAKAGNKATLLPPIKSSRTTSNNLDNTIELIN